MACMKLNKAIVLGVRAAQSVWLGCTLLTNRNCLLL